MVPGWSGGSRVEETGWSRGAGLWKGGEAGKVVEGQYWTGVQPRILTYFPMQRLGCVLTWLVEDIPTL